MVSFAIYRIEAPKNGRLLSTSKGFTLATSVSFLTAAFSFETKLPESHWVAHAFPFTPDLKPLEYKRPGPYPNPDGNNFDMPTAANLDLEKFIRKQANGDLWAYFQSETLTQFLKLIFYRHNNDSYLANQGYLSYGDMTLAGPKALQENYEGQKLLKMSVAEASAISYPAELFLKAIDQNEIYKNTRFPLGTEIKILIPDKTSALISISNKFQLVKIRLQPGGLICRNDEILYIVHMEAIAEPKLPSKLKFSPKSAINNLWANKLVSIVEHLDDTRSVLKDFRFIHDIKCQEMMTTAESTLKKSN